MAIAKQITRSVERMRTRLDWLDSRHSFSFGGQHDPERVDFGPLRVVNEDHVAPGGGFPMHPHRDMEIVSIVLEGRLQHKDSMGNGRVIQSGEVQYMGAGSGVAHSEFNPSGESPVHFLQIWIQPDALGLEPRYADQPIADEIENEWKLILSPDGREGSIAIRQDVELRAVQLSPGASIERETASSGRGFWLFVVEGEVQADGDTFARGDSLALSGARSLAIGNTGIERAKVIVFDVPL